MLFSVSFFTLAPDSGRLSRVREETKSSA
ncbi:pheST operon leader peptide PheM [Rahnella aquatilis]|nr:pheST operon leader peptide PheM [Ewingella americana]UJD91713.1 pheST operon leader peptide PheM [Rahnella aquatilis]